MLRTETRRRRSHVCERVAAIAISAHEAILTGKVGMTGATGALLGHSLKELLYLAEQARMPSTADRAGALDQGGITAQL